MEEAVNKFIVMRGTPYRQSAKEKKLPFIILSAFKKPVEFRGAQFFGLKCKLLQNLFLNKNLI